jgi:hydroxyacylglutathione hydrolase
MAYQAEQSPMPKAFIKEGDVISFGNSSLQTLHTPGHSPGSISYYNLEDKFIIGGDVLFYGSIGRSDLPMGDHDTLIKSIKEKLMPLGDEHESV